MDEDVYKNRQDPAVTVGYRLETGELALIWTTTPWTLPSNLAMAVRPDIDYVVVESEGPTGSTERYLLAEARLAAYTRELGADAAERIVERLTGCRPGRAVATRRRSRYYAGHPNSHVSARRRLRDDRRRHRHRPHRPRLR
jgi:isoleucyl-tRNA synthetase